MLAAMSRLALLSLYLVLGTALYLLTLAPLPPTALALLLLGLGLFGLFAAITRDTPMWWDILTILGQMVGPVLALRMLLGGA